MKAGRIPWIALSAPALGFLGWAGAHLAGQGLSFPDCPFKRLTGLPCATCGLTRCTLALAHGKWAEAFHWHPVAVLLLALLPAAALWDLRRAWRDEAYPALPDSLAARLGALGLLLGTWALQVARHI